VCSHCKGYLQGRVDALNLFETLWGLVESPRRTFRRILLARHKNYVFLLSSLFGMALVYAILWVRHLGNVFPDPAVLAGAGLLLGPPVGVAAIALLAGAWTLVLRRAGGKVGYRNVHAVTAYATMPVVCSLLILFPAELAVFGFDIFRTNPHPMIINPSAYLTLVGLDVLAVGWSWVLMVEGIIAAGGFTRIRAVVVALIVLLLCGAVVAPVVAL
jgi:hypothetical protein